MRIGAHSTKRAEAILVTNDAPLMAGLELKKISDVAPAMSYFDYHMPVDLAL